jgi:hypothetical protein
MQVTARLALGRAAVLVALSALLVGCPLKKKKAAPDDDDPPISNAPTVKVTGSGAKNEGDVLRYQKETRLADEPATIGKDGTTVKTFPGSGQEVATLGKGAPVVKIAKYFSTGVLITFADPTTLDGTRLMGWIPPEALATPGAVPAAVPATPVTPTVKPQIPVTPPVAPTTPVSPVPSALSVDAGAKGVDAGAKPAAIDAGAPAKPTPPSSTTLQVFPDGGKCPAGFTLMGAFCRRACNADKDCPAGTFCTNSVGRKSCSATR